MPRRRVVGDPVQAPAAAVHALGPDLAEEEIGQGMESDKLEREDEIQFNVILYVLN